MRTKLTGIALLLSLPLLLSAGTLRGVLARMDASAASFRSVKANISKTTFTAVIADKSTETGVIWMARWGKKARDVRMRLAISAPDKKSVVFEGKKAKIYYPNIKTVDVYDLGKQRALVDQFLLLGFGTPGKMLAKDYRVKLAGEETVAGVKTGHLELTPKSKKTRKHLVKVELWIALTGGYPVRQKFYWPSEDTTTITYSDVKLNPKLTGDDLSLKLPAGVKIEYPQR